MPDVCDFTCLMPGENSVAVSARGLENGIVSINGSQDLSQYIQFNNGGCVYSISMEPAESLSIYQSCLRVDAQGPSGLTSGSGYLYLMDATGDTYSLDFFHSKHKEHTLHLKHIFKRGIPICHIHHHIGQFFLCIGKLDSIPSQKGRHGVCADPFIVAYLNVT